MGLSNDEIVKAIDTQRNLAKLSDGISNLATGLGTSKDKSTFNTWDHTGKNFDHVSLSARYREDWLSQKVVNIIPQDLTREWREFNSENANEADKEFFIADLFNVADKWARLYGTSFLVIDVQDGRAVNKPINWKKLKKGCIRSLQIVDRTRIVATGVTDYRPMSKDYGMPTHYNFVQSPLAVHRDRLIRFEGTPLPTYERMRNLWYSDSVLIPLMQPIDNFHTAAIAASQMVQEAQTDVVRIPGLGDIMASDELTAAMQNRFCKWKQIKSVFGVSLLDQAEEYENKNIQMSGVKDMIWEYLKVVAAACSVPATRFLSASPDGMNATGESDLVNYIESLKGQQNFKYAPKLKVIDPLLSAHFGIPLEEFKYGWCDIFPESAAQKAVRIKDEADALSILVMAGILSNAAALEEAKTMNLVSSTATVGINPNTITPPTTNNKK